LNQHVEEKKKEGCSLNQINNWSRSNKKKKNL